MSNYHISNSGKPAICRAKIGSCPLGNDNPHYNSKEETQQAIEKKNSKEYEIKNSVTKNPVSPIVKPKKLSNREKMDAKQAANKKDYADFMIESLKVNDISAKQISEDDKSITFQTDTDKRITIKTETTYDMNFKAIQNYTVEMYKMKDGKSELADKIESTNKFAVTEKAVNFNQDF